MKRIGLVWLFMSVALLGFGQSSMQQYRDSIHKELELAPSHRRQMDNPIQAYSKWSLSSSPSSLSPDDSINWYYNPQGLVVSRIARRWNVDSSRWILNNREAFLYDANEQVSQRSYYLWQASQQIWLPSSRLSYSYHPSGETHIEVFERWEGGSWVKKERTSWYQDAQARDTLIQIDLWNEQTEVWEQSRDISIQWDATAITGLTFPTHSYYLSQNYDPSSGTWSLQYEEINSFDTDGYLTSSSYNFLGNQVMETWIYNMQKQPILIRADMWDMDQEVWLPADSITRSFYGIGYFEVDTFALYRWEDRADYQGWSNDSRAIYAFPSTMESVEISEEGLSDTLWQATFRQTSTLDLGFEEAILVLDDIWDSTSQAWDPYFRTEYDYSSAGDRIEKRLFEWNGNNGQWQLNTRDRFYYHLATSIDKKDVALPLHAFPNPSSGKVSIVFAALEFGRYEFHIYDLSGQLLFMQFHHVRSGQDHHVHLDLTRLSEGIYILSVRSPSGLVQGVRLMRE